MNGTALLYVTAAVATILIVTAAIVALALGKAPTEIPLLIALVAPTLTALTAAFQSRVAVQKSDELSGHAVTMEAALDSHSQSVTELASQVSRLTSRVQNGRSRSTDPPPSPPVPFGLKGAPG